MGDPMNDRPDDAINPNTFLDAEEVTALATIPKAPVAMEKPSYASGFEGIASGRFSAEEEAILLAPVDPQDVLIRPDGIVYLPAVWYRKRLLKAFGPGGWAIAPRGEAKLADNLIVYPGALFVQGRYIDEATGECGYQPSNRTMSYADALEGARSALLTRVCKNIGVAMELWDKEWVAKWQKENAHQESAGAKGKIWVKNPPGYKPSEKPADPIPPPPSGERPRAPATDLPPLSDEDFLIKCGVAMDWVGEEAFRSALDLFRFENLDKIPADRRAMFLMYLRKLPKKVKNA